MSLSIFDIIVFILFISGVVGLSTWQGRKAMKNHSGEDYFLAGRGLGWGLIGISLIGANISTEQFVGMSGSAAGNVGLAVASYEWISCITLVIVALFFLPRFIRSGIFTIPEYMEYRYNSTARGIVAFYSMTALVAVSNSAVIYSGALFLERMLGIEMIWSVVIIGILAALYATYGGLASVVWADLVQGSALIIGGLIVTFIGINLIGGFDNFYLKGAEKMHMILPASHKVLPWTALVFGLWIPAFYYWGLNQYIIQRTLGARTLKEGQRGILFAAALKLLTPLVVVIPGIIAFELYKDQIAINQDLAYPTLIREIVPIGLKGFIFAAVAGTVVSALAAMLNSSATIFTLDLYRRHWNPSVSDKNLVLVGRVMTVFFVILACIIAPQLANPSFGGVFTFIQEFQGYISPGILCAFVFGLIVKRTPALAGVVGLIANVPIYGLLHAFASNQISFLNRMAITFVSIVVIMSVITLIIPLKEPKPLPVKNDINIRPEKSILILGLALILVTLILYYIFR
ncbi:MAG: solute:sodium symporter family transporter [Bacteroidetes bacterium]|nr:solute:sodium symporter family transporter [Bacteroidota bacterium]